MSLLLAPTVAGPIGALLFYNSRLAPESDVPKSFLAQVWIATGLIGPIVAVPLQYAFTFPVAKWLWGAEFDTWLKEFTRPEHEVLALDSATIALRKSLASSPRTILMNFQLGVLAAGMTEETLKFAILSLIQRYFPKKMKTRKSYILASMAVGLGYGAIENLMFIFTPNGTDTPAKFAITIIERAIFGTLGHLLTAALTGCKFADSSSPKAAMEPGKKGWRDMFPTIWESMVYHGMGNMLLFTMSALNGNPGWVHPRDAKSIAIILAGIVGVNSIAAYRVRTEMSKLDEVEAKSNKTE